MRGLYIHIPFCNSLCPYCSFYSEKNIDESIKKKYINALIAEIASFDNKQLDTVYIGGGTPSSLHYKLLDKLVDNIIKLIDYKGAEWTIEANPESTDSNFLSLIKSSPVSRVSLGVESFDDDVLKLLGRLHSAEKA